MTNLTVQNASLTVFLTTAGVDFKLNVDGVEHRGKVPYEACVATSNSGVYTAETFVNGVLTIATVGKDNNVIPVMFGDTLLNCMHRVSQTSGKSYYFSWLKPIETAAPCSLDQARKLIRAALNSKAKEAKAQAQSETLI